MRSKQRKRSIRKTNIYNHQNKKPSKGQNPRRPSKGRNPRKPSRQSSKKTKSRSTTTRRNATSQQKNTRVGVNRKKSRSKQGRGKSRSDQIRTRAQSGQRRSNPRLGKGLKRSPSGKSRTSPRPSGTDRSSRKGFQRRLSVSKGGRKKRKPKSSRDELQREKEKRAREEELITRREAEIKQQKEQERIEKLESASREKEEKKINEIEVKKERERLDAIAAEERRKKTEVDDEDLDYGSDSFDDEYSDDFDDDDNSDDDNSKNLNSTKEILEIKLKMEEENQAAKIATTKNLDSIARLASRSHERKFNPMPTKEEKQIEAEFKKLKAKNLRAKKILKYVTLKEESFDFFDLSSESLSKVFANNIKTNKICCIGTQYNDDWVNVGCQTIKPNTTDAGVQCPEYKNSSRVVTNSHVGRLRAFLRSTVPVIEALIMEQLEEQGMGIYSNIVNNKEKNSINEITVPSELGCCIQIELPNCIDWKHRPVRDIHFSSFCSAWILVIYDKSLQNKESIGTSDSVSDPSNTNESMFLNKGLLCLWDLNAPSIPSKILYCHGTPTCCMLSPKRGHIALAGMEEGSVALWDLREDKLMHGQSSIIYSGTSLCIRCPSYTTDGQIFDNHDSSIIAISSVAKNDKKNEQDSKISSSSNSEKMIDVLTLNTDSLNQKTFQIVTIDEQSKIILWTVMELKENNAGDDLGLNIGSCIKLKKMDVIYDVHKERLCSFSLNPHNDEFVLGFASGVVTRHSRHSPTESFPTSSYSPWPGLISSIVLASSASKLADTLRSVDYLAMGFPFLNSAIPNRGDACTSLSISPFFSSYILASYNSGSVYLYDVAVSSPIARWHDICQRVIEVDWSSFSPSIFFVLSAQTELCIFDLFQNEQSPIHNIRFHPKNQNALKYLPRFSLSRYNKEQKQGTKQKKMISLLAVYAGTPENAINTPTNEIWGSISVYILKGKMGNVTSNEEIRRCAERLKHLH